MIDRAGQTVSSVIFRNHLS